MTDKDYADLVALVQEWQAAKHHIDALNEDGGGPSPEAFAAACDHIDAASAALLAWTPAAPTGAKEETCAVCDGPVVDAPGHQACVDAVVCGPCRAELSAAAPPADRETPLHLTTDATVWADEWVRNAREIESARDGRVVIDHGWMVGWFANAILTGHDAARRQLEPVAPPALVALCEEALTLAKTATNTFGCVARTQMAHKAIASFHARHAALQERLTAILTLPTETNHDR